MSLSFNKNKLNKYTYFLKWDMDSEVLKLDDITKKVLQLDDTINDLLCYKLVTICVLIFFCKFFLSLLIIKYNVIISL